jgi:radical SAM superfamily enzyme YgiQ (UPF0313 family)
MDLAKTVLTLKHGRSVARVDATRIRFSAHQCFRRDDGEDDRRCLRRLADHLQSLPGLAVAVTDGDFFAYLLKHAPELRKHIRCVVSMDATVAAAGFSVVAPESLPADVKTVFLCETRTYPRAQMRKRLPARVQIVEADVLPQIALSDLPARAWTPWSRDIIYPIDVPEIEFESGLDMLLIDCPARNLGLMPNGVGYVHNALKNVGIKFETRDLDIIVYHRFHIRRLCDEGGVIRLPGGRALPSDPWQAEHYDLWTDPAVIAYFEPELAEIVAKIIAARPKVLGLSLHQCNEHFSRTVVERVKAALPDVVILVGGFACYSADIGLRGFPLADYMCIGEADLTVGPLVARLAAGERPANTPGVLSRYDRPESPFIPAPMPHDLDLIEHPKHEWYPLSVYRNYNGYQLTPVIASRGCRWSRCTFCAERFYWRIRSPKPFVDELEWLVNEGCRLFMFNESDLNGKPELLLEICDEIIRRKLSVKLTGQLRIHKKGTRAFYDKLRQAGFVALRFGVDAFAENTLRLQKKGYTTATVCQNLKDCWEAGIYTEVNWVLGIPGETEADIEEGIELILRNKPYIGRLANLNPLILVTGGVYWMEPEKHNIVFRGNKEELYNKYPRAIPANLWYSTDPYIDEHVRKQRFERVVLALHEGHFDVGAWASRIIEDVKKNRDVGRTGQRKLSDGVGKMTKPAPAQSDDSLEFNADARSSAYVFRAGSSLPEDARIQLRPRLYIIRGEDELFGIEPEKLEAGFGKGRFPVPAANGGTVDLGDSVHVHFVRTPAANPDLVQTVGAYNVVGYDGRFYAVPRAIGSVRWGHEDIAKLPGVISSKSLAAVFRYIEPHRASTAAHASTESMPECVVSPTTSTLRFKLRRLPARVKNKLRRLAESYLGPTPADLKSGLRGLGQNALRQFRGALKSWLEKIGDRVRSAVKAAPPAPRVAKKPGANSEAPAARPVTAKKESTKPIAASETRPGALSLKVVEGPVRTKSVPVLVGSLDGYNVVEYEGWFYGLPQAMGPLDLGQTDVIEMPGVIRDLSRDVVENEIRELMGSRRRAG